MNTGVPQFDAGMFGVSAAEAAAMDPQQRLLLEAATQLLHDEVPGLAPGEHLGGKVSDYAPIGHTVFTSMLLDAWRCGTRMSEAHAAAALRFALLLPGVRFAVQVLLMSI